MAKKSYKIPASLSDNYLNMEIALQSKDGVGLKPLPVRVILAWLFGLLGGFYAVVNSSSIIAQANIVTRVLFAVVWIAFLWVLTKVDRSHKMQMEMIPALLQYLQKSNRYVITRRTANAGPFYSIVGIKSIDPKTGLVEYVDGTVAYWYSVVGTASVLLFPEDRDAILDRVKDFYDKIGSDCEIIFMTTKEPQRVQKQTAHLMAQYKALTPEVREDEDIKTLVREQYKIMTEFVGKKFKSLHQYMIIKGDNEEALSAINNIVISEVHSSSLMLKQCTALYEKDIENVLKLIYASNH